MGAGAIAEGGFSACLGWGLDMNRQFQRAAASAAVFTALFFPLAANCADLSAEQSDRLQSLVNEWVAHNQSCAKVGSDAAKVRFCKNEDAKLRERQKLYSIPDDILNSQIENRGWVSCSDKTKPCKPKHTSDALNHETKDPNQARREMPKHTSDVLNHETEDRDETPAPMPEHTSDVPNHETENRTGPPGTQPVGHEQATGEPTGKE
jgi:hypothetical protein